MRKESIYVENILPFNKFQCNSSSLPILDTLPSWPMPFHIPILQRNLVCSSQILFIPVLDNLLPCTCSKCTTYLGDKVLQVFRYVWNGWGCRYLISVEQATQKMTQMQMYMWVFSLRCKWKFQCRLNLNIKGAPGLESWTGGRLVSPATGSKKKKKNGTPYILSSECTFDCI